MRASLAFFFFFCYFPPLLDLSRDNVWSAAGGGGRISVSSITSVQQRGRGQLMTMLGRDDLSASAIIRRLGCNRC